MSAAPDKVSTTALARKLELPTQQLFATLRDYGWIVRQSDTWVLTNKGEFEGGEYVDSRRYGRYIVWPEALAEHRMLAAIESTQRITAAGLRRYYSALHPRQINRVLAELGFQQHTVLGWELTAQGKKLGGQQRESENSGAFYITWPHEIADHPAVNRELERLAGMDVGRQGVEGDLFEQAEQCWHGIDGHILDSQLEQQVCNWLYLAQLPHAYRRALPVEEELLVDFYLPSARIYLECWEDAEPAERLSLKLRKRDVLASLQLEVLEINARDRDRLDETLGRALLDRGIRV
jgi:hypothetical protein